MSTGGDVVLAAPSIGEGYAAYTNASPPADARAEYVPAFSGGWGAADKAADILQETAEEVALYEGTDIWNKMAADPVISSSLRTLKLAIIGQGLRLNPAVARKPKAAPPPEGMEPPTPDPEEDARVNRAEEIHQFCVRALARLRVPVDVLLYQMLECISVGCKLSEMVYRRVDDGIDAGSVVLDRIKVKPGKSWRFAVDPARNVIGIQPNASKTVLSPDGTPGEQAPPGTAWGRVIPRSKFFVLTWLPKDDDPRGSSSVAACYRPWAMKVQVWIEYVKYLCMFATPGLIGFAPDPNLNNIRYRLEYDSNGEPVPGVEPVAIEVDMVNSMARFGNATAIVLPFSAQVQVVQSSGDGEAHLNAIDLCDRQITLGLLGATRMTQEAQSGSKADSETAADVFGLLVRFGQGIVCRAFEWDVLYNLVLMNFGLEDAEQFTPTATLGDSDIGATAELWLAFARLYQVGALDESQLPEMFAKLGLPEADMDARAIRLKLKDALARAQAQAAGQGQGEGEGEGEGGGQGDGSTSAAA